MTVERRELSICHSPLLFGRRALMKYTSFPPDGQIPKYRVSKNSGVNTRKESHKRHFNYLLKISSPPLF